MINPQLLNFRDLRLTVRCEPGGLLNAQEASVLCQRVSTLFENQGAVVFDGDESEEMEDTGTPGDEAEQDEGEETSAGDGEQEGEKPQKSAPAPPPTDLVLELRARKLHEANNLLSWVLCLGTFTIVPAVTESTFAQDVVIRDGTGSLLVSESLEGRLIERFGAGTWVGNKLMDLVWRDDEDKLTGDVASRDLSADLYRQLSQLMFNAKMQSQVLRQAPAGRGR